jgi:hypothetical protein
MYSATRFTAYSEFDVWRAKYEATTCTTFLRSQDWPTLEGHRETWRCNRSWRQAGGDLFQRPNRSKPSIKLETHCVCTLDILVSSEDVVTCRAFPLHNHWVSPSDLRSRRLSAETRSFVNNLSAMGLSDNAIISMVRGDVLSWENRDEFDTACTRDILLTKQDIRNVKRLQSQQLDPCDTTSFEMMVRRLQAQEDGPVRFFKGPGEPARLLSYTHVPFLLQGWTGTHVPFCIAGTDSRRKSGVSYCRHDSCWTS